MDLNFTQEYEEFRAEVRGFWKTIETRHQAGLTALCAVRSVWLGKDLLENGYARTHRNNMAAMVRSRTR